MHYMPEAIDMDITINTTPQKNSPTFYFPLPSIRALLQKEIITKDSPSLICITSLLKATTSRALRSFNLLNIHIL